MSVSQKIDVTVQIGKKGLTEALIKEIMHQLQKRKTVKIKLLRSSMQLDTRKGMQENVVKATESEMVADLGNIIVIQKKEKQIRSKSQASNKR